MSRNFIWLWSFYRKRVLDKKFNLSSKLSPDLAITDIDRPLYKFGMIYKYDINNYYSSDRPAERRQKIKCFSIISFLVFTIIRLSLCLRLTNSGRVPEYLFDFVQEIGGLVIYFYIVDLNICIMSSGFSYYFCTEKDQNLKWIEIIKVLKGISAISELKIDDKIIIKKFVSHIKKVHNLIKLMFKSLMSSVILIVIMITLFRYKFYYFIQYGFISSIIFYLFIYLGLGITYHSFGYFYYICYYCKVRVKSINQNTEYLINKTFTSLSQIDKLLKNHNNMCKTIQEYNRFWSKIYALFIYNLIPCNLIILHQFLNQELPTHTFIAVLIFILFTISVQLSCNSITASVSKEVSGSHKLFIKLFLKLGPAMNTKRKLKVKLISCIFTFLLTRF